MKVVDINIPDTRLELSEGLAVTTKQHKFLNNSAGFTLVELIVVAAILGVLAGLVIPSFNAFVQQAKITRVISEVRVLEKDILAHLVSQNTFPNSLNDIDRDKLRDPWGNPYQYLNIANGGTPRQDAITFNLNTDFDIYSLGPNGLSDTNIKHVNSLDDIVRTSDGGWVGTGEDF